MKAVREREAVEEVSETRRNILLSKNRNLESASTSSCITEITKAKLKENRICEGI
jgi:hypothetical protein